MKRWRRGASLGLALTCILSTPLPSTEQQPTDELKKDIQALKEAVTAIQKDVQEIKVLLQQRPQQPTPPPQSVVLELGKNPFKGDRNAKLTLVEFSDYQ